MHNIFLNQFRTSISFGALALAFAIINSPLSAAQQNLAGTWKASFATPNGQTIESTLKIKQDGDKLSGVLIGRNGNETPFDEITLNGDQLSLRLIRERNGEKVTTKVAAKVTG